MRVDHQAEFHPRKYLRGLLANLRRRRRQVFERQQAEVTEDGVTVGRHKIRAPWVVMATHNPLQGRQGFLQHPLLQTNSPCTRAM